MLSIADILIEQGRVEGDRRRRSGERWGSLATSLGQIPATIVAERERTQDRALQQRRAQTQDALAQEQLTQAKEGRETAKTQQEREQQLGEIIGANVDPETQEFNLPGALNLAQQKGYAGLSRALVDYSQNHDAKQWQIAAAKATATAKTAPEFGERDPTKDIINKGTGQVITPGVPKVEKPEREPTPTEASLAFKAAGGDTQAQSALNKLLAMKASNGTDNEPLVAIMRDGKAVLVRRRDAVGQAPANTREQGRPVVSGDANRISDINNGLDDIEALRTVIAPRDKAGKLTEPGATGTLASIGAAQPAWLASLTGWTEPKQKQAMIDRVKQVIGKTLEGGVLRKEDEEKYKKILPTIADTVDIVETKLNGLRDAINRKRDNELDALEDAGYEVSRFRKRGPGGAPSGDSAPAAPPGWKYVPKAGGGWTAVEDK